MLAKMAEAVGEDPGLWIVRAQLNKTRSPEAAAAWARYVLGRLCILLALSLGATTSEKALSNSGGAEFNRMWTGDTLCAIFRGWLRRITHAFARVKLSDVAA